MRLLGFMLQPNPQINSLFCGYLTKMLVKDAYSVSQPENDGSVSVRELHEYARSKVQEAAPAMKPEIYQVREGSEILLAHAPIGDPRLRYRKEAEAAQLDRDRVEQQSDTDASNQTTPSASPNRAPDNTSPSNPANSSSDSPVQSD